MTSPMKSLCAPLWQKLNLTRRVMLVSGGVLLLTGIAYFNVALHNEIDSRRNDLQQILQHELDFLSPAIAEPAVIGDYALIQRMLAARVEQAEVLRIVWTDLEGHRLQGVSDDVTAVAPA